MCQKIFCYFGYIFHMKIGIIGLGIVGGAIFDSFKTRLRNMNIIGYDKYKNNGIGSLKECSTCDMLFVAVPTLFSEIDKQYDVSAIHDVLNNLKEYDYNKLVIIKSTVEPTFTEKLSEQYQDMHFVHNPEFLTARTALDDFNNQKHIVLGITKKCDEKYVRELICLYKSVYESEISTCTSTESELMKISSNSFYAVKVQFFNEIFLLSQKLNNSDVNFDTVTNLMVKNGWINPMHTKVPGPDGLLSYGGMCFPKDTNALCEFMKKNNVSCEVLSACIGERNKFRKD